MNPVFYLVPVSDLCLEGRRPSGLVLESPFNNIFDEVRNHPMAWVWRKMPWFDWFFTSGTYVRCLGTILDISTVGSVVDPDSYWIRIQELRRSGSEDGS